MTQKLKILDKEPFRAHAKALSRFSPCNAVVWLRLEQLLSAKTQIASVSDSQIILRRGNQTATFDAAGNCTWKEDYGYWERLKNKARKVHGPAQIALFKKKKH